MCSSRGWRLILLVRSSCRGNCIRVARSTRFAALGRARGRPKADEAARWAAESSAGEGYARARRSQGKTVLLGRVWRREYWDRFIRDEKHYRAAVRYIEENPV